MVRRLRRRLREWWTWRARGMGSIRDDLLKMWGRKAAPEPSPRRLRGPARALNVSYRSEGWREGEIDMVEEALRDGHALPPALTAKLVREAPMPREMSVARDIHGRALSPRARRMAARKALKLRRPFYTPFYSNPRQGVMYHIIEAVSTQTFCHTVINVFMGLVMGTRVRPELYLLHPSGDDLADNKELEKYRWVIDAMEAADRRVGQDGSLVAGRSSFFELLQNLVRSTIVYNRGALVMHEETSPLEVDGRVYKGIPASLQFVHARDLGTIHVDDVGDLLAVSWDSVGRNVEWADMVYLWNSLQGEEVRMTRHYGLSALDGIMATLRSVYQVLNVDIPACAKATYAGHVIVPYNVMATDEDLKAQELAAVSDALVPGGVSVVAAHPEDLEVKPVPVQGDMTKLTEYLNSAYREICSAFRIPQSVIFDEAASNRATMTGKLIYTTRGMVRMVRNWIDRAVGPQWYGMMLRIILDQAGEPGLADKIGVRVAFDDLSLEGQEELMDYVSKLVQLVPISDKAILDLAGHPELITEIDEAKRQRMEEMGAAPGMPSLEMGGDDGGKALAERGEGDK